MLRSRRPLATSPPIGSGRPTCASCTVRVWRPEPRFAQTLERARAATDELLRADWRREARGADLARPVSAPLGLRPHRPVRGALVASQRERRSADPDRPRRGVRGISARAKQADRDADSARRGRSCLCGGRARARARHARAARSRRAECTASQRLRVRPRHPARARQQETMLETLQSRPEVEYPIPYSLPADRAPGGPDEIDVPGGSFVLGSVDEPWAYDNELAPYEIELRPFRIDRAPVTNGAVCAVREEGVSIEEAVERGRLGLARARGHEAPLYWETGNDGWERVRFGRREPVPANEPVQHVSWYEADAFARWAGKRLPTEIEWERAAGWHDHEGKFRYPWGQEWMGFEASLDRDRFCPAQAGSYAGGVSPVGCVQMGGDVWEWTSSRLPALSRFSRLPLPRALGGLLRRRVPRSPRWLLGDRRTRRAHDVSQLGIPRRPPRLRRLPLRPRRLRRSTSR